MADSNGNGKVTWGGVGRLAAAIGAALAFSLTAWRIHDGTAAEIRAVNSKQDERIIRIEEGQRYIHNRLDEIGADVKELLRAERDR